MKVDIIGGGIAGLALGIHLQKNNIQSTIYESHNIAGGLCTGWKRGSYTFNGCLHWLLGTQPGISFYTFWKEIIDIDQVPIHYFDEKVEIELPIANRHGDKIFHFYNDIDRFETYLIDLAPEDKKEISHWADRVRFLMKHLDFLPPVFRNEPWWKSLLFKISLARLMPILPFMLCWGRYSNRQYAQRFRNPFLRTAIAQLYENEMRMTVLMFAQAYAAKHISGYPLGGSKAFAQRLVQQYEKLGGCLRTDTQVNKIIVNDKFAVGLQLSDGKQTKVDYVASAADWHSTVYDLLDGRFTTPAMRRLRQPTKEQVFYSFCMLHLGIAKKLSDLPHFMRFPIAQLRSPDGSTYQVMEVHIYNYDPQLAPAGKTNMSVNFTTREGDFWIDLRRNNRQTYEQRKQEFTQEILQRLSQKFGNELVAAIEVTDMTTPATYNRYTHNLRGSSQGWTPQDNIMKQFGVRDTLPGLRNFVMLGHWQKAGGGVPVAVHSARYAAWKICKAAGQRFNTDIITTAKNESV